MEADAYFGNKYKFRSPQKQLPLNVHWPKEPTSQQMDDMREFFGKIETILYKENDGTLKLLLDKYVDSRSFVDWWIVHEVAQNAEPNGPRSCYMYRDGKGLLKAGPVWDFDLAFINVGVDMGGDIRSERLNRTDVVFLTGDSLYNKNTLWYGRLLSDEAFCKLLKRRWKQFNPRFGRLIKTLEEWKEQLQLSALADEQL